MVAWRCVCHELCLSHWDIMGSMGQHYVPQYYLEGFCDPLKPANIWVYEKGRQESRRIPVKVVASENDRWPSDTEQYLANEVEEPANPILRKIRARQTITRSDKEILSAYMVVMLKRVPRGLERTKSLFPQILEDTFARVEKDILRLIKEHPSKTRSLEAALLQLPSIKARYANEFPTNVWYDGLKPDMTPQLLTILPAMTWRFLTSDRGQPFLTNDNPLFFFESMGMGKPESEIMFPISSSIALLGTWQKNLVEGYFHATEPIIKEINRRTAYNASRYVYYSQEAAWVVSLVNRKTWRLNKIR